MYKILNHGKWIEDIPNPTGCIVNVAHPDLSASRNIKILKAIALRTHTINRACSLTDTLDGTPRDVGGSHLRHKSVTDS